VRGVGLRSISLSQSRARSVQIIQSPLDVLGYRADHPDLIGNIPKEMIVMVGLRSQGRLPAADRRSKMLTFGSLFVPVFGAGTRYFPTSFLPKTHQFRAMVRHQVRWA
jgi:hypothetical protein